jgi:phosphoribosylformylglycinamidine (FGAM) synthase-like enzyme
MAFASHCGLDIINDNISALFNEELGCVIVDFDLCLNQSVAIHSLWSCPIAG